MYGDVVWVGGRSGGDGLGLRGMPLRRVGSAGAKEWFILAHTSAISLLHIATFTGEGWRVLELCFPKHKDVHALTKHHSLCLLCASGIFSLGVLVCSPSVQQVCMPVKRAPAVYVYSCIVQHFCTCRAVARQGPTAPVFLRSSPPHERPMSLPRNLVHHHQTSHPFPFTLSN